MDDIVPPQQTPLPEQRSGHIKPKKSKTTILKYWRLLVVLVALVGVGLLVKGYLDTKNQLRSLSDSKTASQADGQELVKEISKYFILPNETPTVATVSDVDKLKNQEFFKDAKSGDKVLIFPDAGRALLYRPSISKIIEYSKVNLNTDGTSKSQ